MDSLALAAARIQQIEARQDDVLLALEALDHRVECLVAQCLSAAAPPLAATERANAVAPLPLTVREAA